MRMTGIQEVLKAQRKFDTALCRFLRVLSHPSVSEQTLERHRKLWLAHAERLTADMHKSWLRFRQQNGKTGDNILYYTAANTVKKDLRAFVLAVSYRTQFIKNLRYFHP